MSPRAVPTPSAERVEKAYAEAGGTLLAAPVLGINYRTLERRMRQSAELRAAADRGRAQYAASRPLPPHGTRARYQRELAARPEVEPCAECRAANAVATALRKPEARSAS